MSATVKWSALTSRGTVLSSEMNNVAGNAYSALGSAYDNSVNRDRWGWIEIALGTMTNGGPLYVFLVPSLDGGTVYDDGPSTAADNFAVHLLRVSVAIKFGGVKKIITPTPFALPPCHFKFGIRNGTTSAIASSGNTMTLFTSNEVVV